MAATGLLDDRASGVVHALQLALLAIAAYGGVAGRVGVLVNGVLAFGVTLVPAVLRRRTDYEMDPRLAVWIAVAAVIHAAGFLGPYDSTSGVLGLYDQVAHVVSAGFVAGIGYALVEALDRTSGRVQFPEKFRFLFTVVFVMAFGVAWEIGEFAAGAVGSALTGTEVLVQYGIVDIVSDLVFNTLAAVVVAVWGRGYFDGLASVFSSRVFGADRS